VCNAIGQITLKKKKRYGRMKIPKKEKKGVDNDKVY
jgi:hypothetical protein